MTDFSSVISVIKKINSYCNEIDALAKKLAQEYDKEEKLVTAETVNMIAQMKQKYDSFKENNFESLRDSVRSLEEMLCETYMAEKKSAKKVNPSEYERADFATNHQRLKGLISDLNDRIGKLNNVDYNKLVPPISYEVRGESVVALVNGKEQGTYDYESSKSEAVTDTKPVKEIATEVFALCSQVHACLNAMESAYEDDFDISAFNSRVNKSAKHWLNEKKASANAALDARFDDLFRNEKKGAVPKSFFEGLYQDGKKYDVNMAEGSDGEFKSVINIGDMRLLVEKKAEHIKYLNDSPVLKRYMSDGHIGAPLLLNLKNKGNVLINVDEDTYSENTVAFVNQLIMQFILSFPANRINICLIDIDNKMNFSSYKSLTKINNDILLNGIIRDDRQLENTIKDMEQTMYRIDDDILSYNGVSDIYEYNEKFKANPQSVHLFVLVNYPSGMRDDTAKRVTHLVQSGNKSGIFSIIVNNKSCPLSSTFKPQENQQFLDAVAKSSVVLTGKNGNFKVEGVEENYFQPKYSPKLSDLNGIIDMLIKSKDAASKVFIHMEDMFANTEKLAKAGQIRPFSEVLDIPIGARGGEVQTLRFDSTGEGSAHAVAIGGTGSGKSNLLHAIILGACHKYSPEELNLYLVDFKGGVEFRYYEANKDRSMQLPHVKLTSLTSDLEDGLAVLDNLKKEMDARNEEFKKYRVEDIMQYTKLGHKMPRLLVIIDEIQELFQQDEKLGQKAISILREFMRQGRSYGINILWASQNVPSGVPGLKENVLSQIGNRISLRLNEPEDAAAIKIDPKAVRNLNRPEKGLAVINDIRTKNDCNEFRVAYAKTSEERKALSKLIIDKWKHIDSEIAKAPLFIVGDDIDPSPLNGATAFTKAPTKESIVSKAYDSYTLQLGEDYSTGKPFDIKLNLVENSNNLIFAGYDVEVLRDMMGYATLSAIMEHKTNKENIDSPVKMFYANGEMINPKNSNDLFNIVKTDFEDVIENVSSVDAFKESVAKAYKLYKQRGEEMDRTGMSGAYSPCFFIIHSLQRYTDLFKDNPQLDMGEKKNESAPAEVGATNVSRVSGAFARRSSLGQSAPTDAVFFVDAFKELLARGGSKHIHFIISTDNISGINEIKNELADSKQYHCIIKGVNVNNAAGILSDSRSYGILSNPKVALVVNDHDYTKIRMYRYDSEADSSWYKKLCDGYKAL